MTDDTTHPVKELSEQECWDLLAAHEVGRLATTAGGVIDIFPITYVIDRETFVFRTGPGTKLVELTINDQVALEIDHYDESSGYSVIVHGRAEQLDSMGDIDAAAALPLTSLFPTDRPRFVRITPTSITGRRFTRQ